MRLARSGLKNRPDEKKEHDESEEHGRHAYVEGVGASVASEFATALEFAAVDALEPATDALSARKAGDTERQSDGRKGLDGKHGRSSSRETASRLWPVKDAPLARSGWRPVGLAPKDGPSLALSAFVVAISPPD
jgi:hypothetical protein